MSPCFQQYTSYVTLTTACQIQLNEITVSSVLQKATEFLQNGSVQSVHA